MAVWLHCNGSAGTNRATSPCRVGMCHQLCTKVTVMNVVVDTIIIITAIPNPSDMCPSDLLKHQFQDYQQAKDSLTAVTDTAGGKHT